MRIEDRLVNSAVIFALLLVLSAIGFQPTPSAPAMRTSAIPAALMAHAPIYVNGNAGFNATNGVTAGAGTAANPYIIEGWNIAPIQADGIELYNTTAHAIIRNLAVYGQDPAYVDVLLWGASNVTVENVTAPGSAQGIYLYLASHVTIRGCHAPGHDRGSVTLYQSDNVSVDDNDGGYGTWGVRAQLSSSVSITNNRISNVTQGVDIEGSAAITVSGNRVVNGSGYGFPPAGIYVSASDGTVITDNTVTGLPSIGIRVENSSGILMEGNLVTGNALGAAFLTASGTVTHNRLYFNVVQSEDTLGKPWNASYPTGGNYWSDYDGVDHCRGPAQNDCSAPDGVGDTPYLANGSIRDRYPLKVYDLPPHVAIDGPTGVMAGRTASFRAVILDPSGTMTSVDWDFGDGSGDSGVSVVHTYANAGAFRVHVTLTDNRSLTAQANASITVWPAVTFVLVSHPSGFQLPVPADWETHRDYSLGGQTVPVLSLGPTSNGFRTNLLVSYLNDAGAQENPSYLSEAVNGTLASVRQSQPGASLAGGLTYRTVSGHAAVDFTIRYFGASFLQRAVLVVSAAHGRDWLVLLSTSIASAPQMNATFDSIVAGFTITALPTWAVLAIVGAVIGATAMGIAFVVIRYRKKRAARPKPASWRTPPPYLPGAFCTSCGTATPAGSTFCGNCGARVGGGSGPQPPPNREPPGVEPPEPPT